MTKFASELFSLLKGGRGLSYQNIQVTTNNGICIVKMNRPEVRNALGLEMREELRDFFIKAKNQIEIKVIVLTGEGKAFSAGGDLQALKQVDAVSGRKRLQSGHELINAMLNLEKPIIAAINGVAAGAGVSLAVASDIIIAKRSVRFIQSFINVGLIPDLGAIHLLPRLIGRHRALELMFLGEKISAEQAQAIGLINRVVEDDQFTDEVETLARRLADSPDMALGIMKKLVNRSVLSDINETMELEGFAQGLLFESENFKEGVNAFFEKRKPQFNQKNIKLKV